MRRNRLLAVLCIALLLAGTACSSKAKKTQAAGDQFADILAAAKKEAASGTAFTVWISTPKQDKTHKDLFAAFEKQFDLPTINFTWTSTSTPTMTRQFLTEAKSGRIEPDIILASQSADALTITKQALVAKVDWQGLFGKKFPTIGDALSPVVIPEYKGPWIDLWDAAKVMMWNTDQIKEADVPVDLEAMAAPALKGKVVLDSSGFVLDQLSVALGEDTVLADAAKLKANSPVFANGSPAAMTAVATGQGAVTPNGTIGTIIGMQAKGQHVDWKPMSYGIPIQNQFMAVTASAKNPNLARLFAAWLTTDGQKILVQDENVARINYAGAPGADKLKSDYPNAKLIPLATLKDIDTLTSARAKLTKLFTGAGN